jgi:hypothetical protein
LFHLVLGVLGVLVVSLVCEGEWIPTLGSLCLQPVLAVEFAVVLTLAGEGEWISTLGPLCLQPVLAVELAMVLRPAGAGVSLFWPVGEITIFGSLVLTVWGV